MPRRRWPVDRDAEPDEEGTGQDWQCLMKTCKSAQGNLKSRLSTDKEFAGFWEYLATERDDFVTRNSRDLLPFSPERRFARG